MIDLKFDGMTELQDAEVMEVNGGIAWLPIFIGAICGVIASELNDRDNSDFNDGREAARDFWN